MTIPKLITRKEYEAMIADKETLQTKCKTLEADLKTSNDNLTAVKESHVKEIETLKAEHEKKINDLNAQVVIADNSSEEKAIRTLAQVGIPADETVQVKKETPSILEQVSKLQGVDLSNFLRSNKAAIFRELNNKNAAKKN